jgi:hypothetical protein
MDLFIGRNGIQAIQPPREVSVRVARSATQWRNKPISLLGYRLNKQWRIGGISQSKTQFAYGRIQSILKTNIRAITPYPLLEFFSRHNIIGAFQQRDQHLKGMVFNPQ